MLKILWKRGEIAPEEQFLPLPTMFFYLMLDFYVKTGIRFSVRDKRLFEITEVEIMRVDCILILIDAHAPINAPCLFSANTVILISLNCLLPRMVTSLKMGQLLKERICSMRSKFFCLIVDLY